MKNQQTIIVTGGAGFIGSHTVLALIEAGYRPVIVDNFVNARRDVLKRLSAIAGVEVEVVEQDCSREREFINAISRFSPIAGIIHFAAFKSVSESVAKPLEYYRNNLDSTIAVMQAVKELKIPAAVYSSSCTVYGLPAVVPVTETTPMGAPSSPYAETKQIGEQIFASAIRSGIATNVALLRYFNPIGAHPSGKIGENSAGVPDNLVPALMQRVITAAGPFIVNGNDYPTSDGTCVRDYIHVMDLAEAHVQALAWLDEQARPVVEAFNLGTGSGSSVLEVIHEFEKVSSREVQIQFGPRRAGDIPEMYADPKKAQSILDWKAKRTMTQALEDAWRWQLEMIK